MLVMAGSSQGEHPQSFPAAFLANLGAVVLWGAAMGQSEGGNDSGSTSGTAMPMKIV
jgi:hypothetical protein